MLRTCGATSKGQGSCYHQDHPSGGSEAGPDRPLGNAPLLSSLSQSSIGDGWGRGRTRLRQRAAALTTVANADAYGSLSGNVETVALSKLAPHPQGTQVTIMQAGASGRRCAGAQLLLTRFSTSCLPRAYLWARQACGSAESLPSRCVWRGRGAGVRERKRNP